MKSISYFFILLFLGTILSSSCDKIDPPYTKNGGGNDTGTQSKRVVLLEEFTGHKCPNCPKASSIAHDLKKDHPNQVIVVSVHAGIFSSPDGSGEFTYNFRTTEGTALNDYFKVGDYGYPNGLISRIPANETKWIIEPQLWTGMIDTLLDDPALAKITITPTYNSSSRTVTAGIEVKFLSDSEHNYNIAAIIIEDSIIKPQKNNDPSVGVTPVIDDYVHMGVYRGAMNGTWGEDLATTPAANDVFTKTYSKTLGSDWNENHCSVVAYIYNKTTLEIMEAAEISIK